MKRIALLAVALGLFAGAAAAEDFPKGPVEYIIPFGPGGESDVSARLQQPFFNKLYGQEFVVTYKPGGGGAVAWSQLNSMAGDGSVIMGVNLPHIIIQPKQENVGFTTEDITSVYIFHYTPDAIVVPANSPYKTLADLIADAKAHPREVIFAGSGKGTGNHLAQVSFDKLVGMATTYVPFKGTGAAVTAIVGNQVKAGWSYTTAAVGQQGQLRVLAVATEERHPAFPEAPTFKELGFNVVSGAYRGIAVPKTASEEMRKKVSDAIAAINANKEFRQKMIDAGFALVDIPYGKEMDAFMAARAEEYIPAAKAAGVLN